MCAGLLKAPTWQPSINAVLHYGAARSSSRFRGSAIWACHLLTSHPVRGEQHPCSAELFCVMILLTKHFILSVFMHQVLTNNDVNRDCPHSPISVVFDSIFLADYVLS